MDDSLREEIAAEAFENAIEKALKPYGGEVPFRCNYCGHLASQDAWDLRPDPAMQNLTDLVVCRECGSTEVSTEMTKLEFAEWAGLMEPNEPDDNPVEDEDFWARCDAIRRRK